MATIVPQTPTSSKGKAPSVPDTTPLSRREPGAQLSQGAKIRVRAIDPNDDRCLVENCCEERAVDFAHVFPKWYSDNFETKMDSIEWYWNMGYKTLNLDSRWNIMRLGSSIHRLFDKDSWVLVPEERIVDQYHATLTWDGRTFTANRAKFPDIKNRDDFKYTFIPIGVEMRKIALLRHEPPKDKSPLSPLTPNDFVVHTYPFGAMPMLKSHIHPKFVILEAGLVMSGFSGIIYTSLCAEYPILSKILGIFEAWTIGRPTNAMQDRTYNGPRPEPRIRRETDGDSEYTEPVRKTSKRQRQDDPATPSPAAQSQQASGSRTQGKQRALMREPSICLSKRSLEMYDRTVGTENWTSEEVQKWSEGCRALPRSVHTPWVQPQTAICV